MKYFAYGSNMDQNQMIERCPDSKLIGKGVLKDHKIAFTIFSPKRECGCADVISSTENEVWGLIYEVSESDIKNLDKKEGHPVSYNRSTTIALDDENNEHEVEVYKVTNRQSDFIAPSHDYLGIMLFTAEEFNFPDSYKQILKDTETKD